MCNCSSKGRFALGSLAVGVNKLVIVGGIGERVDHRLIDRQPIRHVLGAVEKLTVRCQWNELSADGFDFGGSLDV